MLSNTQMLLAKFYAALGFVMDVHHLHFELVCLS
jgi:hypothetical protein